MDIVISSEPASEAGTLRRGEEGQEEDGHWDVTGAESLQWHSSIGHSAAPVGRL